MRTLKIEKLLLVVLMEDLTPKTIINEVPGPQLDHWVAENIMTIPQLYAYDHGDGEVQSYIWDEVEENVAIRDHYLSIRLPSYSTDIAEAWKVVEELNSRGLSFGLELDGMGRVRAGSRLSEGAIFEDREYLCTVPEAICKAALLIMLDNKK